ncbi:MAG TPA: hypothetical protein VEG29_00755 [Candidatus Binatia bacterium]|nr:hypothetical protein [Candidatus Binatia bacterium]
MSSGTSLMHFIVRILVGAFGVILLVVGAGVVAAGFVISGLFTLVFGAILIFAATFERRRYRSGAAERTLESPGPGGGEPTGPLEPRFQRTAEVFIDPTTHTRMRVWVDPGTGERRYLAEG